jgi:hypothetical protein
MRYYWDLSCLLDLQEATIIFTRMKMSLRLQIVSPFKDGLIELVAITSGRIPYMIRVDILASMISSHPSP